MNVRDAIKYLSDIADSHPELKLKVWIQTGPDSFEWREVTQFGVIRTVDKEIIVDVDY